MRAAIYARVSTNKQETEMQLRELGEYCRRQGWESVIYQDEGISGRQGADTRPGLKRLLDDAALKRFDVVLCWKIDRFARNARILLNYVEQLTAWGVNFVSMTQPIDTRDPITGKLVLTILAAVAEMECEQIRERVKCGLQNARANGKKLGQPFKYDHVVFASRARERRTAGCTLREIAAELEMSRETVRRLLHEH